MAETYSLERRGAKMRVIINESQIPTILGEDDGSRKVYFSDFLSSTKEVLSQLLNNPDLNNINQSEDLQKITERIPNGLIGFVDMLMKFDILRRKENINDDDNKMHYEVSYSVPKDNFSDKLKELCSKLFKEDAITEGYEIIREDGGACSCGSVGGQYEVPVFGGKTSFVSRPKISSGSVLRKKKHKKHHGR